MKVVRGPVRRPMAAREDVRAAVEPILTAAREGDEVALRDVVARFDRVSDPLAELRVPAEKLSEAADALAPELRSALELAITNVGELVRRQLREPVEAELAQGQRIVVEEVPLRRAGVYAPGGHGAYPSTVVMCAITAREAGVDDVVVCSPPGPDGFMHPVVAAACQLCGVDEAYRIGGAQAVAAMAYGAGVMEPVDVIAGPGNAYVTEAKRLVAGDVGIDGLAGPSELVVVVSEGADPELVALDLLAQAEHGEDGFLAVVATDPALLDSIVAAVEGMAPERATVRGAELFADVVETVAEGLAVAERVAPEHLELVGAEAEALAADVRRAGALYVGNAAATAFGDYVAGSNHVLPTGGAARFQSALSASTFRRRMARVTFPGDSAAKLAAAGATIADAEGFPVHGESMRARA